MSDAILVLHLAFTGYMAGLIWFVQLVHYPLMSQVGAANYPVYQRLHMAQTTWAVSPMVVELCAALWLFFYPEVPLGPKLLGAGLLALVWGTTAVASVPAHTTLAEGFDARAHQVLVKTNWVRTVGWTARLVLASWMLLAHG